LLHAKRISNKVRSNPLFKPTAFGGGSTPTLDRMKRRRFLLGRIENPTWKDYFRRVGGAMAFVAAAILASREFLPGYEGVAVVVVCIGLIAFVGAQEWRQGKARRERRE
jgi:hypothetical protein